MKNVVKLKPFETMENRDTLRILLEYLFANENIALSNGLKEKIKEYASNEIHNRLYSCSCCGTVYIAENQDFNKNDPENFCCGEVLTKVPNLKPGDRVRIIGYNSVEDLEFMEFDDNFSEFLLTTELVAFTIIDMDISNCNCRIAGYPDWIEAEIFEKFRFN